MPITLTEKFGDLEYEESSTIEFPQGLPGFDQCHRFILVEQVRLAPLVFLQSLDAADLSFMAVPVREIVPDYQSSITAEDLNTLGLDSSADRVCLALLAATENGKLTANLLAPVVVNPRTHIAVQAVRDDACYSHLHPLEPMPTC